MWKEQVTGTRIWWEDFTGQQLLDLGIDGGIIVKGV
jgi:hypothetical protein